MIKFTVITKKSHIQTGQIQPYKRLKVLSKCIFHDLKINHVFIIFYIFCLLCDINNYNKMLQHHVIWLHSSVGGALV